MYYICTSDNIKIAVCDLNPAAKKTIFMVHGWPLSHKIFEYQLQPLIDCGYRIVMIDIRGFGNSDIPACEYSYDRISDDIYEVVRALGLCCFTLAGFSMGGGICVRYMARHNSYGVKKLVLIGAAAPSFTRRPDFPYGVPCETVNELIALASTDRAQLSEQFGNMLFACPHSTAILNYFKEIALSASGIGTVQAAISLRDEDMRSDLCKICVPTGIFHGKRDQIVPFELALVQQSSIQNATLFPFENSGHGVFYDELESFNHCFIQFLEA